MPTEIRVDITEFQKSSSKLLALLAEKGMDAETFMRQRGKAVVKTAIITTPPGSPKVTGTEAKKRGTTKIASDAAKAVIATTPSKAESTDVAGIIESLRGSQGRVKKPNSPKTVPRAALNAEIRRRQGEVGKLAAGLNTAAGRLGYKPPAWIWRHNSPGSITIKVTRRGIRLTMVNGVDFASKVRGLEKRFQSAIDEETRKNSRQLDYLMTRAKTKAGFK